MMQASDRGTLVHDVLEVFFREMQAVGRPKEGERWTDADRARLFDLLDEQLGMARDKGLLGIEIFGGHERSALRADLAEFLEQDSAYRLRTGAVPDRFEQRLPQTQVAGLTMRGIVDRIDRSLDRRRAWVLDYKTGGTSSYDAMDTRPLAGGARLQLPAYLLAVGDAEEARAFYWFISQKGGFAMKQYEPTPELTQRFEDTIGAIAGGVRAGVFPAVPGEFEDHRNNFKNCGWCDFDRICSRRREEAFTDKRDDPAMVAWLNVAETADGV
jgi:hypothetical protein